MIKTLSTDHGATLYRHELSPDFAALHADDRVRATYNANDWTPGDYTYAEDTRTLYLTGTGERLWEWDGSFQPKMEPAIVQRRTIHDPMLRQPLCALPECSCPVSYRGDYCANHI